MLEIRLESMQQTELRLKCLIIIGRSKVSPIVSPKKTAEIVSRNMSEFKHKNLIVDKMKPFDYKNPKITAYLEIYGTLSFLCSEKWEGMFNFLLHVFPGICNLHKHSIFSCVLLTLCSIFYASKRKMSLSQNAMTHSGYISAHVGHILENL